MDDQTAKDVATMVHALVDACEDLKGIRVALQQINATIAKCHADSLRSGEDLVAELRDNAGLAPEKWPPKHGTWKPESES